MLTEIQIMKRKDKNIQKSWIRINPDNMDFNDYEEFDRVSAYIIKSKPKNQLKNH